MILPGATLGMLGGGQLGRMFTQAARTMGYEVMVLDPDPTSPAAHFASAHIQADYADRDALSKLAKSCGAITTEFENVPADTLAYLAQFRPVRPGAKALSISQDRIREKTFLTENGISTARFAVIHTHDQVTAGAAHTGLPAVLKLSRSGYDGKGQRRVTTLAEAEAAFNEFGHKPCVLEQWTDIAREISVVLARGVDGKTAVYTPSENWHRDGILDLSVAPARVSVEIKQRAIAVALQIASALDYCGVMAVEFFVLKGQQLLVNEIAPRPHNTGHYTLDACITSQFEQQVRALCALPLGDTALNGAVAMVNLLGDLWHEQTPPNWEKILAQPQTKLHLYGKSQARPGRKMGHYTCLAKDAETAIKHALAIQAQLQRSPESMHSNYAQQP